MNENEREAELLTRLAALESRLAEVDQRAREAAARARDAEERVAGSPGESLESLFALFLPSEARDHLRTARKEQLLAVRAVIDKMVDRLDRKPPPARRRRETISLEDA